MKEGAFFADCKRGAAKYFRENKLDPRVHWGDVREDVCNLAGIVVGHWGSLKGCRTASFGAALAFAVLHGTCKAEVGVSIQHDANHGAYGNNRTWLHAMQLTLDIVGASSPSCGSSSTSPGITRTPTSRASIPTSDARRRTSVASTSTSRTSRITSFNTCTWD